jgi:hypothetical protein
MSATALLDEPATSSTPAKAPSPYERPSTQPPAPAVMPKLPTYAQDDVAGQLKGMKEDGFAIIPGVLDAAEVAEMRRRIDDLTAFGYDRKGAGIDHFKCVFNRHPYWLKYLDHPGVIGCAEATMGDDCHVIGQTAWRTPPGEGGFGVHVDQLFFPVEEDLLVSGQVELPVMLATAHFYLDDLDLDLCPTWIVPGSHKSGRGPGHRPGPLGNVGGEEFSWRGNDLVPVLLKAGDVMIFRSEVWHSGSRNLTPDRTRYLLQTHYGRRMMAQKFSPYLDFHFSREVLSQTTPRQRRLLGSHQPSAYD